MNKSKVKKEARKLLKQLDGVVTLDNLMKKSDCLICFFNHRDMPGDKILEQLGENHYTRKAEAFSLINGKRNFIFLKNALSEEAKLFLALHELGHLRLGHNTSPTNTFAEKINYENEANSFAGSVLNHKTIRINKINLFLTGIVLIIGIALSTAHISKIHTESAMCFITATGKRYHIYCEHLQDNYGVTWLTVKEATDQGFTPCKDCFPEKYR